MRHGESQANAAGVIAGQSDSPLSGLGQKEAEEAGRDLRARGMKFDVILSSPLSRAHETARIIAQAVGYPLDKIIVIDDLKEKGSGDFEGKPPELVFAASEEAIVRAGVESFDATAERVRRANAEIATYAHGTTLIVGHAAFYRMARCVHDGAPPSEMLHMRKPRNATLVEYPL
ncbi:MAG TPA: histidine phosphatase family protein [Candidatus Saccharimonadaceae bacterium]|nr:histidine phosphatase family protein [Candidatus Saccharimonadaceae bacterium]